MQEFAAQLIAGSAFVDIDDSATEATITAPGRRFRSPRRASGCAEVRVRSRARRWLIAEVCQLPDGDSVGGVAILCNSTSEADATTTLLKAAGIPSINLLEYVGVPVEAVTVGTIKRARKTRVQDGDAAVFSDGLAPLGRGAFCARPERAICGGDASAGLAVGWVA